MNKMNMVEVSQSLSGLFELFGRNPPTDGALIHWWETLKEFDYNDVMACLGYWARDNNKPPTPADVWGKLNDQRARQLEAKASAEAVQNKSRYLGGSHHSGPTEYGRKMLSEMKKILSKDNSDKYSNWHLRVLEKHANGHDVPYISLKRARQLVGE